MQEYWFSLTRILQYKDRIVYTGKYGSVKTRINVEKYTLVDSEDKDGNILSGPLSLLKGMIPKAVV